MKSLFKITMLALMMSLMTLQITSCKSDDTSEYEYSMKDVLYQTFQTCVSGRSVAGGDPSRTYYTTISFMDSNEATFTTRKDTPRGELDSTYKLSYHIESPYICFKIDDGHEHRIEKAKFRSKTTFLLKHVLFTKIDTYTKHVN